MTKTYTDKNGHYLDVNIAGGQLLDKITLFLFDKLGCDPKTKEDCLLVARNLKNYIRLQKFWQPYWIEKYGIEKNDGKTINWLKMVQNFFENADGIDDE